LLKQSQASLDRLYGALLRLKHVPAPPLKDESAELKAFRAALADDLNTPEAIAGLFALATAANTATRTDHQARAKAELIAAASLFGVLKDDPEHWFRASFGKEAAAEIDALVAERVTARANKDFAAADKLRTALAERGVEVMDGPAGSTWRRRG